jgi:hypothetical protein
MAQTREQAQASITDMMQAMAHGEPGLARVLAEPWRANVKSVWEKAKRRLQVEHVTRAIQPVNARGVAYRLQAHRLIRSKDAFRIVETLVYEMRREGRLPFHWITDEGRELWLPGGYDSITEHLAAIAKSHYRRAWKPADVQVIVCVEKAGQHGVYLPVAQQFDVPLVATEGFCSLTRKHDLAELVEADPRDTVLANLGDQDDSGIDIMRDTHNWVQDLSGKRLKTMRIAVLPEHVAQYGLATRMPGEDRPHAGAEARLKDIDLMNRTPVYDARIGHFDLDALDPNIGRQMLRDFLLRYLPEDKLAAIRRREQREQREIKKLADNWPAVRRFLRTL